MKNFPKKYKPQDLKNRAKSYQDNIQQEESSIYNINWLPTSKKIKCSDFFLLYIKDFYFLNKNYKVFQSVVHYFLTKKVKYHNLFFSTDY